MSETRYVVTLTAAVPDWPTSEQSNVFLKQLDPYLDGVGMTLIRSDEPRAALPCGISVNLHLTAQTAQQAVDQAQATFDDVTRRAGFQAVVRRLRALPLTDHRAFSNDFDDSYEMF